MLLFQGSLFPEKDCNLLILIYLDFKATTNVSLHMKSDTWFCVFSPPFSLLLSFMDPLCKLSSQYFQSFIHPSCVDLSAEGFEALVCFSATSLQLLSGTFCFFSFTQSFIEPRIHQLMGHNIFYALHLLCFAIFYISQAQESTS